MGLFRLVVEPPESSCIDRGRWSIQPTPKPSNIGSRRWHRPDLRFNP
jgi:hypothetical protein